MIRAARAREAATISELALRSKAHWSYTKEQLEVFREELTISPEEITTKHAHVAEEAGAIVGFFTLARLSEISMELEHIFVEPDAMGRGIGARLFERACGLAESRGATTLVIQSDPNAAGFYLRLGAKLEGEIPSSIPGRTIPRFVYALGDG